MKKSSDPRHQARIVALKSLFEWTFLSRDPEEILEENFKRLETHDPETSGNIEGEKIEVDRELAISLTQGTIENLEEIDKIIARCASDWPIPQVAKVDLTILRLSIFEIDLSRA